MNSEIYFYLLGILDPDACALEMTEEDISYLGNDKVQNVMVNAKIYGLQLALCQNDEDRIRISKEYADLTSNLSSDEKVYIDKVVSKIISDVKKVMEKPKQKKLTPDGRWKWGDEE